MAFDSLIVVKSSEQALRSLTNIDAFEATGDEVSEDGTLVKIPEKSFWANMRLFHGISCLVFRSQKHMKEGGQSAITTQHRNGQTLSYVCEWMTESGYEGLHTYRITVTRRRWGLHDYLLVLIACFFTSLSVLAWKSFVGTLPILLLGVSLIFWARGNRIEQEAVVVIPTLGIQLETVYCSKKVDRHFVSLDRIVTPVINKAVTPVTCYFYLALILQEEEDLLLTLSHLRPSLAIMLSVWRSIHEALGTETCRVLPPRPDWGKECVKNR